MSVDIQEEIAYLRQRLSVAGDMLAEELADFPEARMDFCQDEPVWARWSAEVQLRHIACVPCRWLLGIFRKSLLAQGYQLPDVDMKTIADRGGRHVPPEICPDRASLIAHTREMYDFALKYWAARPRSLYALSSVSGWWTLKAGARTPPSDPLICGGCWPSYIRTGFMRTRINPVIFPWNLSR